MFIAYTDYISRFKYMKVVWFSCLSSPKMFVNFIFQAIERGTSKYVNLPYQVTE